ncbi:M1 family aminopeptidase [Candidatus Poribacteria bacterium]
MCQRILLLISLCILTGCAVIPQTPEGQKPREASPREIEWQPSFKSAVNIASARKMPMMLVFYGVSSRRLDQNAFSDPDVIELAQQFVCLKIGADQGDLTQKYVVQKFPTIVFTDSQGGEYDKFVGYKSRSTFADMLKSALIPVEAEYSLRIESSRPGLASVKCIFRNVRQDSFFLMLREKHDKISNISYTSEDDRPGWREISKNIWLMKFTNNAMKTVTIQYEVELNITSRTSYDPEYVNYVGDDYGVLDGHALFLMPQNLHMTGKVQVKLGLPVGWRSITPWEETGSLSFMADSVDDVVDSVFCIGRFQFSMSQLGEHEIYAVLSGAEKDSLDLEQKANEMTEVFRDYVMRFGDYPFKRYLGIFAGKTPDGRYIHGSAHGTGFTGPVYVDHTFMAHEAFHVWNGGTTTQKSEYEVWFKEGFTQYYGYLTPHRIGLYDKKRFSRYLERDYGTYLRKYGTDDDMPLTRVKEGIARKEGHEQSSSARVWIMYYKGALVASLMDNEIRKRTDGRKSLDDVMYYIFQEFRERKYSSEDVLEALNTVTQQDFSQFFSDFVYGTAKLPPPNVEYVNKNS